MTVIPFGMRWPAHRPDLMHAGSSKLCPPPRYFELVTRLSPLPHAQSWQRHAPLATLP